jgi:hypothetical protein
MEAIRVVGVVLRRQRLRSLRLGDPWRGQLVANRRDHDLRERIRAWLRGRRELVLHVEPAKRLAQQLVGDRDAASPARRALARATQDRGEPEVLVDRGAALRKRCDARRCPALDRAVPDGSILVDLRSRLLITDPPKYEFLWCDPTAALSRRSMMSASSHGETPQREVGDRGWRRALTRTAAGRAHRRRSDSELEHD